MLLSIAAGNQRLTLSTPPAAVNSNGFASTSRSSTSVAETAKNMLVQHGGRPVLVDQGGWNGGELWAFWGDEGKGLTQVDLQEPLVPTPSCTSLSSTMLSPSTSLACLGRFGRSGSLSRGEFCRQESENEPEANYSTMTDPTHARSPTFPRLFSRPFSATSSRFALSSSSESLSALSLSAALTSDSLQGAPTFLLPSFRPSLTTPSHRRQRRRSHLPLRPPSPPHPIGRGHLVHPPSHRLQDLRHHRHDRP